MSILSECASWGGLFALGRSCPLQDRQVCPLSSTDWYIRKQRRESRRCQECLRTTREHFRLQPYPKIHFLYISLVLSFQNIHILVIEPHFSFMLFFICHASNLLHFSVQLSQIEQRLFLRVHQCVTLFLSVQVHVFNCPPVSVDLLSMISGRASDSLHVMFFTCAQ